MIMKVTLNNFNAIRKISLAVIVAAFFSITEVYSQDVLTINLKADHADWVYKPGEEPVFTVTVLRNGKKPDHLKVKYQVGPEKMQFFKSDSLYLKGNSDFVLKGYTMDKPGFLRYTVTAELDGKK